MQEVCAKEDGVVFTEDLKAMLHLSEKHEDVQLVVNMIQKYIASSSENKFSTYVFGPVVMRLLYYLNEPSVAVDTFSSASSSDFFKQTSTLKLLLCLLYKNNMYSEMKEMYDLMIHSERFSNLARPSFIVMVAACCKQNTSEALEYALHVWKILNEQRTNSYKCAAFMAYLAIKQNRSELALEILATVERQQYIDIRCLKVLAYLKLEKYLQIIPMFRSILEMDTAPTRKQTYFSDVITAVEEKLASDPEASGVEDLLNLIRELKRHNRITVIESLEEHLFTPINPMTKGTNLVKRNVRDTFNNVGMENYA
ncbi:Pentatricopeptide repeat-containing protein 2 [Dufourea novaeangliae]|uniref:Pentatricopeptide repeat-containing protein 2 n=2 Tax=Dufourea novaeangliae TaxID=178035 RepID=A0A154P165_DUFNO|nr:Pentatricopeptide repeat-containing protein 2 [Dufourea novaeangliae]